MVQFTFAHIGLCVCAANLISGIDQPTPSNRRIQAVRSEFASRQAGLATVHGNNLDGLPLRTA